jgi:hypothetical protein
VRKTNRHDAAVVSSSSAVGASSLESAATMFANVIDRSPSLRFVRASPVVKPFARM